MQDRNLHVWPWEDEGIDEIEYTHSLQSLNRFLGTVDVSTLHTLEDVSAVASLVGHDLHVLAVAKGKKIEKKIEPPVVGVSGPLSMSETVYVLKIALADRELSVMSSNGHVALAKHSIIGFARYQREDLRFRLPTDRDIAIGEQPNVDEESVYVIDARGFVIQKYHPTTEPHNVELQQKFTHALKEGVRDIVSALVLQDSFK